VSGPPDAGPGPGASAGTAASATPASSPVRLEALEGGALWQLRLAAPRGNVLDLAMIDALSALFREAGAHRGLKAVCLSGEGGNFSFGASVPEHRRGLVETMLPRFHALFRTIAAARVPVIAAVEGRCLGGGLELAAFCQRLIAAPGARFGQPEIALAVFAPVASLLLPGRIGRARAEDLLLSGRLVDGREALAMGLVDELADDPLAAALGWARAHLLPKSASSLRFATAAARADFLPRFEAGLARLERNYLDELMATRDANEGVAAFLEKRSPAWSDA